MNRGSVISTLKAWSTSLLRYVDLSVDASGNLNVTGGGGGGGGATTIADGADVTQGATTDVGVTGDNSGTLSAKLRGLTTILASVWDSVNGRLKVDGSAVTQPVSMPAQSLFTHTFTTTGANFDVPVGGASVAIVTFTGSAGIGSPTVSFRGSVDGTTFQSLAGTRDLSGASSTASLFNTTTDSFSSIFFVIPVEGLQTLRFSSGSTYSSSTVNVQVGLSQGHIHRTFVEARQGSPNATVANAWPTKITDGTTVSAVKAASTAAAATDPALVVRSIQLPTAVGQAAMAASLPVAIASDQSAVPVSAASLPLPTGAATSANQTTGNTSLSSIDTKTPALGQALAAASVPVVLPAAQITTLTPPAAITGFALDATLTGGTTKVINRGGAKGATAAADVTSTANGADHQGLDVQIQNASIAVTGPLTDTQLRATAVPTSVADGSNVTQGSVADAAWVSGSGTVIALLKKIASAGGSAVSIADGADVAQGTTTNAAITSDTNGTVIGFLRGLAKIFGSVWDSVNSRLKVDGSGVTQPVSGTFWQATQPVSGTVTTTPPANASTNVAQVAGTTTDTNSGVKSAGTLRVVLATDQPALTNKLLVTPDSVALPANQSVNVNQVAGTAADTNSGVKSAGTLRVVLATDQPALTNKLLVTPDSVALPANQSVNVNQLAGTAPDVNSGVKSAGTLRVVLATDQPALTNKLLVTPDSVALPANQSVNVNQFGGNAVATGTGASGVGVPRVTVANDSNVIVTPPTLTKGTQAATGFSTQDLKDSGRVNIMWTAEVAGAATSEGLLTVTESRDGAATTTFTTKVVTSGKRLRITSLQLAIETLGSGTAPQRAYVRLRFNTAGAVTASSPLQGTWMVANNVAIVKSGANYAVDFPDGIEFLGDGTKQIGVTIQFPDWVVTTATVQAKLTITAFEY